MKQMDMNVCADKSFQAADAELNTVYSQIKARLSGDPETADLLVAAQRAWLPFRDAECKFASFGVEGGSIYPTIYAQCLERLTRARGAELKNISRMRGRRPRLPRAGALAAPTPSPSSCPDTCAHLAKR